MGFWTATILDHLCRADTNLRQHVLSIWPASGNLLESAAAIDPSDDVARQL